MFFYLDIVWLDNMENIIHEKRKKLYGENNEKEEDNYKR